MKSYLSLIPISAKVHRRENRMTRLCIIFSVFMVTAVFSMAEMGARMEQSRLLEKHGSLLSFQAIFESGMGQSLILTAMFLFLLILVAGVLMISGSINSSVAQRTKFFGMMRCIGMSRQQIIRFVRLEALNWCKMAIPVGLVLGIGASWVLCAILRFLVGEEFSEIPLFGVSVIGLISGIVVGVVTVLLAARAPARRAAKVSPVAAVLGNFESHERVHPLAKPCLLKIEMVLGISHGLSARKNLILMTGSFALSILLFLNFSVLIDFVDCLMPQSAAASDIDIASGDGRNSIDAELVEKLKGLEGVKQVYGRRNLYDIPAESSSGVSSFRTVDLVSFDDFDLECLKKDGVLRKGSRLSKVYGDSSYVLATWDLDCSWKIGDKIQIGGKTVEIAGLLKYDLFNENGLTGGKMTLIASDETFIRLTDERDYSLIMVQTGKHVTDEEVAEIQQNVGKRWDFRDKRDQSTRGTYLAFVTGVYGFLGIITLVTVLNIVNSISMSVSARVKQYGAMRAVGMDGGQITRMIGAEAFTYAFLGCAVGCGIGLPLSRMLYKVLIENHFSYAVWEFPAASLAVIFGVVICAAIAAVYAPAKRIRNISVTETINEL